jgi:hypothetical protein
MTKSSRLLILAGLAVAGTLAALAAVQTVSATSGPDKPAPCVCSALEKLEYTPLSPAEPLARLYVGHCQCGNLNCVVTSGALQCTK